MPLSLSGQVPAVSANVAAPEKSGAAASALKPSARPISFWIELSSIYPKFEMFGAGLIGESWLPT